MGVNTAGQDTAGGRGRDIVGAGQTGHGVEQHHHVLTELHEALRTLDGEFGDSGVVGCRTVEGGGNHFALHRAFHIGNLFRTFVHEHDHQVDFRIVGGDRVGDVLQGDGLAGLRRGHDQTTLALADRCHNVDEAAGELVRRGLLLQTLLRVQRGELVKLRAVLRSLDGHAVDGVDGLQWHELLTLVTAVALTRGADGTVHRVAFTQAVLLDLAHGDVHIVRPRQIAGRTHESVGIEHVDDACDWHEILFRLLVALFAFDIAIRTIVTVGTIIAIIAIAVTATTIVTLVIIAVTSAQTASATIHTITPVAGTATATAHEIAILGFVMTLVVLVALRRQRGENIVEITHDILILQLLHRTATATWLGIGLIILAVATTVVLLRRSIIQSQFGKQIGG